MNLPFKKIFHNYVLPERLIYTDVSDRSGAGFCTEILRKIVRRAWTKSEAERNFIQSLLMLFRLIGSLIIIGLFHR